tara:strand:- start:47 stop:409 length:363 start_codon:yes stop_codon:yes gene_type:complete
MALPAISAGLRVATAIAKRVGKKLVKTKKGSSTFGQTYVKNLYQTKSKFVPPGQGIAPMTAKEYKTLTTPILPSEQKAMYASLKKAKKIRKVKKLTRKTAAFYLGGTTTAAGATGGVFKG